jgi:protein SCO1/2
VLAAALLASACAGGGTGVSDGGAGVSGAAEVRAGDGGGWRGTAITAAYPLPDQTFTDTSGATLVPAQDAAAPVTLVFFGYTSCPDICNVVLANVASALRGAPADVRDSTELLFVTTDPARDTPEAVRGYLDRFDESFEGLVAPVGTVEEAAQALHVSYERPDGSTGGYEVEHGAYTTAFVGGSARVVWPEDVSVADLRADLERLAGLA